MAQHEGARVMKTETQDVVQLLDKRVSEMAPVDESRGVEPNEPFEVGYVREEKGDLTGRAYEYFHKLQ
jgi:hypothetical protein